MSEPKQEYTGTWIPAAVMLNEDLKPMEKMLYAEIASFTKCWSSNEWLGKRLGVSERTITTAIKKLKEMQLITVVETNTSRVCIAASQILLGGVEKIATPLAEIAIKNNNKNKVGKEYNSSTSPKSTGEASSSEQISVPRADAAKDAEMKLKVLFMDFADFLHPKQNILYTPGRRSKMIQRLRHFKADQLYEAARNLMQSSWHMGDNPNNKKYASFDFLMRNDEMVEKWLNEKPAPSKPKSAF